jgi:peroxiredoxin
MEMPMKEAGKAPNIYVDILTLANTTVFAPPGRQLKLGQLWQKQPVIMVFLRHFACIACRAHADQIWQARANYEKTGAKLVFIGNGNPDFIAKFQEDLGMQEALVLTDPSLESFKAAGFRRSYFAILNPKVHAKVRQLKVQGYQYPDTKEGGGSKFQLGGVLAVDTKSKVLYHFRSEYLGDYPSEPHIEMIKADESKVG